MSVEFLALFGTVFAAFCAGAAAMWVFIKTVLADYKTELANRDLRIVEQEKEKNELAKTFHTFEVETWARVTKLEVEIGKMHAYQDIGELFERTLIKLVSPLGQVKKSKEKVK